MISFCHYIRYCIAVEHIADITKSDHFFSFWCESFRSLGRNLKNCGLSSQKALTRHKTLTVLRWVMFAENLGVKLKSFIHNLFELYYIPYTHTWKKIHFLHARQLHEHQSTTGREKVNYIMIIKHKWYQLALTLDILLLWDSRRRTQQRFTRSDYSFGFRCESFGSFGRNLKKTPIFRHSRRWRNAEPSLFWGESCMLRIWIWNLSPKKVLSHV